MLKNILNTTLIRILNAVITFVILLINARVLGSSNLGTIGLILLNLTIVLMINNLFGGGALIYLTPRYSFRKLMRIAYLWAFFSSLFVPSIYLIFNIEPQNYLVHIYILAFLLSFSEVNKNLLLGKERISKFNILAFLQYVVLLISVLMIYFVIKKESVESYLIAMYVAWGFNLLLGLFFVLKELKEPEDGKSSGVIKGMLKYGVFVQLANLAQFLNYRLSYFFVEKYLGRAQLGIFDVGNKLAEGVWLFGRSISLVQYTKISNTDDNEQNRILTLRLFRFSLIISCFLVGILIALPESFYLYVFGNDFTGLYQVVLALSPGIIAMSGSMIFSHYFAGTGKHYLNAIGSGLGLIVIIISCLVLIPEFKLLGAALSASLTYSISFLYNIILFKLRTKSSLRDFLFRTSDFRFFINFLKQAIFKNK